MIYRWRVPAAGETFAHFQLDTRVERPRVTVTETFLATDIESGAAVMLEVLRAGVTGVEKARFTTRARRLQAVKHPYVLAVLETAPTHCVLEAPTNHVLEEHAGIAIARSRQKLLWLSQVATAVAALHKGGMVHGALSLDEITVSLDASVKVTVPVGGDVSGSPLDDIRAFAAAACDLILGAGAPAEDAKTLAERLHQAGAPLETAAVIARIRTGSSMTSEDLAEKLAPFSDYAGPSTEPLLPIVPCRA